MENVIVTGATGFIGRFLLEELLKHNVKVVAVIRENSDKMNQLKENKNITVVECNLDQTLSLKNKLPKRDYDIFFDLAWAGVAGNARADYKLQLKNVEHGADAVKVASEVGCKRFIGSSSVSEYECAKYMPIDEIQVGLRFIYSTAKVASHYMNKCLAENYGIEYINANIANTYGEYGNPTLILHDTILKLLKNEPTAFTNGDQIYDFLYVKDIARALYAIGDLGHPYCSYYIGSGSPRPLKEYLCITRDFIDKSISLGLGKLKSDGMNLPVETFDSSKLLEHTGFAKYYTFEEGIKNTIEWFKKNNNECDLY